MTIDPDQLIDRLRTAADDVPVPPIKWTEVTGLSRQRRRRRIAAVTTSVIAAVVVVAFTADLARQHSTTPSAGLSKAAPLPATPTTSGVPSNPGSLTPMIPPDINETPISGKFDAVTSVRQDTLSKVAPYAFELVDGTNARLISATLLLLPTNSVPIQLKDRSGQIAQSVLANAVAIASAKPIGAGRWSVRLDVPTTLRPGTYTLVYLQVTAWTKSGPGTGTIGDRVWGDIPDFGTLTVKP